MSGLCEFAQQRRRARRVVVVVLRDPVAFSVVDRVDRLPGLHPPPDHLLAERVIHILRLHHPVDRDAD